VLANLRRWVRKNSRTLGIGIFLISLVLNNVLEMPHVFGRVPLGWVVTVLLIIVLNVHLLPYYWAKVRNWVQLKCGLKPPDKENYICKSNYILPFNGKWCVWEGGVNKELSVDWNEVSDRFTYFFIMIDDHGKSSKSDDSIHEDYYSYGKDVLAATDGVVVKVCNKHLDKLNATSEDELTNHAGTWDIVGNHIIIKHNENEYSCVGNLMHDSIVIKVGDNVKQGEVIAKCGNSGYTTEVPCLYFHLISSKSFYLSTSLPIAFTNIKAENSTAFDLAYKNEGATRPSTQNNLEIVGDKSYVGRGLDVENGN